MPTTPDHSWLQWLKIKLGLRDNEYDTGKPGKSRNAKGLIGTLPPEKQRAIRKYRGPENLGR